MPDASAVALAVVIGAAAAALLVPRSARPQIAARLITLLAVFSAVAFFWTLLLIAAASFAQLHGIAERLSWCNGVVSKHSGAYAPVGGLATLGLFAISASAGWVRRRQRSLRAPADDREIAIVGSAVPTAFSLPGRPGQIIVSTAMLQALDAEERRVLFAHERAHLRCHHRYVRLTQLAAATFPVLDPLNARVRLATERWADEEAARDVGSRDAVARAIARAAIAQVDAPPNELGMADAGVLERVEALLDGDPRQSNRLLECGLFASAVAAAGALALSVALVEPSLAALVHLC